MVFHGEQIKPTGGEAHKPNSFNNDTHSIEANQMQSQLTDEAIIIPNELNITSKNRWEMLTFALFRHLTRVIKNKKIQKKSNSLQCLFTVKQTLEGNMGINGEKIRNVYQCIILLFPCRIEYFQFLPARHCRILPLQKGHPHPVVNFKAPCKKFLFFSRNDLNVSREYAF